MKKLGYNLRITTAILLAPYMALAPFGPGLAAASRSSNLNLSLQRSPETPT